MRQRRESQARVVREPARPPQFSKSRIRSHLLGIKIVKEKAIALRVIPEQPEEGAMRENSRIFIPPLHMLRHEMFEVEM